MRHNTKIYSVILFILIFIIGTILGAIIATNALNPPAYPGVGDWNGDGVVNLADLIAVIDRLFNGAQYPEIVYG